MNNRLTIAATLILTLLFCFICLFTDKCEAQPKASDDIVWWLCRELDRVESQLGAINASLNETREELAEMKGRQAITIGAAAGTPTGLAGLLWWWIRKSQKKKEKKEE